MKNNNRMLGNIILLGTAMVWGLAFAFQRDVLKDMGPFTFGMGRMFLAAVFVWVIAFSVDAASGSKAKLNAMSQSERKEYNKATYGGGLLCGIGLMFGTTLQQLGLAYTTAGKSGFLTALYIVLIPIITFFFFKKRHGILVWVGVVVSAVGLYLLSISEAFTINKGDLLTILSAFCFVFQILCCDYFTTKGNTLRISAMQLSTCVVLSAILAFTLEHPEISQFKNAAVALIYCGIFSGALGYTGQLVGQKYAEPTTASLIMSFEAVFAVTGGVVLLHESFSLREIIGCVLMFTAIILVQVPSPFGRAKGAQNGK